MSDAELIERISNDPELLALLLKKAQEFNTVIKPTTTKAPFNPEQQAVYDAWIKQFPYKYIIPEPPRNNIIRVYNKLGSPPFDVIGNKEPYEWRSIARVLNTELNYWDKKPVTDEHLWVRGLWMFLVSPENNKFFAADTSFTHVGVSLFVEDQHDAAFINDCRGRTQDILHELMKLYAARVTEPPPGTDDTLQSNPPKRKRGRPTKGATK